MDRLHDLIGGHYDDAATFNAAIFIFPVIPETGEGEDFAIFHTDVVRNLIAGNLFPLIEAISGYQAAPASERSAIGRLICYRLNTGIDG